MQFKSLLLVAQGCKKVNSCKIRFRHEMTDEAQPTRDRIVGGTRGVTSIYTGRRRAIFCGAFFRAGNKFWGIIFGKIIGGHKFWGIIFSITNYGPIIRYLFPT